MLIAVTSKTKKTGLALGEALGVEVTSAPINAPGETVINWGSHGSIVAGKVVNTPEACKKCGNKAIQHKALQGHTWSIPVWTEGEVFNEAGGMYVSRPVKHFSGYDFVLLDAGLAPKQWGVTVTAGRYVRPLIDIDTEYRVHVMEGKIIRCMIKVPEGDGPDPLCRTHSKGWVLQGKYVSQTPKGCKSAAKQAVEMLGLNFGAVDVCTTKGGGVKVIEVNSSPGLIGSSLNRYAEKIKEYYA